MILTDNTNRTYLKTLIDDLKEKYNEYLKFFNKDNDEINEFINKRESSKSGSIQLKIGVPGLDRLVIGKKPVENAKKHRKQFKGLIEAYKYAGGIMNMVEDIERYNVWNNKSINILYSDGSIYLKDEYGKE